MHVHIPILTVLAAILPSTFAQTCATINPAQPATFAPGYTGRVLINGLKQPRGIIFDNQGNILTTEKASYGVRYISLTDNGGINVCVKSSKQLIADSSINHGIALTPDGKTLFVSSLTTVWSWSYDGTTGTVSNKKVVIQNLRNGGHSTRTLLVSKSSPNTLLVSRGSDGNIDTAAGQISTGRSQIRAFSITAIQTAPVDYTGGEVLGWGLRNSVGVAEDPLGAIWSVENSVDDMTRDGKDVHQTNPCEELNYHGKINDASNPVRGAHFGYPDCFSVWDPTVLPGSLSQTLKVGQPFAIGTPSGSITDAMCQQERQAPKLCFPSHTAPLDIKFNANGSAAYVPFHGSWDKSPADGYRLSRVAFNTGTGMPVDPSTSTTAAFNVMWNANTAACPNACFRPVNVAFGTGAISGRLFMTSDTTNEIWVIGGAA